MKIQHQARIRRERIRQQWFRSGGIELVLIPKQPVNPPAFEGPKEPVSVRGMLRRWMQHVRTVQAPEYASSISDLAARGALVGNLSDKQYRAFRRGKLKIVEGIYPQSVRDRVSSVDLNHVLPEPEVTYKIHFDYGPVSADQPAG